MSGPLQHVRVLDATRLMPFSYGTHLLGLLGAEVVKVERPGGEYGREMEAVFRIYNRGKRSIVLDLRSEEGREALLDVVTSFDVFVESFRPGFLDSLGLGYDAMSARAPHIVYCSSTGYGASGSYSNKPGHDLNYMALAGLLAPAGGVPAIPPVPYIDMAGGLATAFAISAALVDRERGASGRHIDLGMTDVALSFNGLAIANALGKQGAPTTQGSLAGYPWPEIPRGETPCYGVHETADGRYIALANIEPKFWDAFLETIGRFDLEDERFATGERGKSVTDEIGGVIKSRTLAEWDAAFAGREVCYAPVLSAAEAYRDPHFMRRPVVPLADEGNDDPVLGLPFVITPPVGPMDVRVPDAGADQCAIRTWSTENSRRRGG